MGGANRRSKAIWVFVVAANILLIACVVSSVVYALSSAQQASFLQNIENIRTLTDASAEKVELEFEHHTQELQRAASYVNGYRGTGMTEERLRLIFEEMYAPVGESYRLELVDSALSGTGNSEGFAAIDPCDPDSRSYRYAAESYPQLAQIFCAASQETLGTVRYTNEFTDPLSLEKVSAIAGVVRLLGEDGGDTYKTLLLLLKSSYVSELLSCNNDLSTLSYFDYSNIIVDDDGNYVISNAQFQGTNFMNYIALYNSSFTQQEADALENRLHGEDYADVLYYDNSRGQPCAYTIVPVQNSDWHILSIVPLASFHNDTNSGERFLLFGLSFGALFLLDIALIAFINRQLRRKTSEAQAASEAKTDFLSRMSHDIRTPINVINCMTELAMQEENPPETQDYLKDIRSASTFLLGLVNDVLDMNKVESGKMELFPQPYPFREFKAYVNAIISPLCAAKGIEFTVVSNEEDIVLSLDKMRLNQIVFNLLSNAVKFTPENGHVGLAVALTRAQGNRATLELTVQDDGIGMSEEFQKTMFSAFAQENRPEERQILGTGLGLAIVKNLVDIMHGAIRVDSAIGRGTAFYISIETGIAEMPAPLRHGDAGAADLRGKRVLLCEDQPMNAKIIVRLLGLREIETEVAENGKIGVETLVNAAPGRYDAVLMDVRMPVMNGIDAAKAIRAVRSREDLQRIPIIALTANAYDSDVRACLDAGMNEHLAKPIDRQLLFEALERQILG